MPEVRHVAAQDSESSGDLRRLLGYLLRHKTLLATSIICSVIAASFLGGSIALINPLVSELTLQVSGVDAPATDAGATAPSGLTGIPWLSDVEALADRLIAPALAWLRDDGHIRIPLAIVVFYVLKGIFAFFSVYGLKVVGLKTVMEMRRELYDQAISQTDAFFRNYGTSDMMSRIMGDAARIQNILSGEVGQAVQSIPIIAVCLLIALASAWQITLLCLVAVPLFVTAASRFGRRVKKASRRTQERSARITAVIEETLIARRVVQAFDAVEYEKARFSRELENMQRQELKVARSTALTPPTMELLGAFAGAGVLIYAGSLKLAGVAHGESVLVAILALFMMFANIRRLGQLHSAVQQALASARRVFAVLDEPVSVRDAANAIALPPFHRRSPSKPSSSSTIAAQCWTASISSSGEGRFTHS
ncbi:MAG: hypothetical protein HC882_00475 [Acidobacteria bacterium]|nr:hypothetical protein [Acidobacteriota bacterium]